MRLVLISNYFNHHQKTVSDELYRLCDSFCFVETNEISEMRKKLGYSEMTAPYVIKADDLNKEKLNNADVIIIGAAPIGLIDGVKRDKLIFYYSERPFKKERNLFEHIYWDMRWRKRNRGIKAPYMLCSSAFAAVDYSRFGLYKNKLYKWGYFPKTETYDLSELFDKKDKKEILWCGRFLDWKHPDDALTVAKMLKSDGYGFNLSFIGTGEMEQQLRKTVNEYGLDDCVSFLGSKNPEKVRRYMEKSGIFLMTSDRQEGWGAVLNEAMNSGCAVVASHSAGSTHYLIKHKENGLIYTSGNIDDLYNKVKYLLNDPAEQKKLGASAYNTITDEWNAQTAAQRLVRLFKAVLDGEKSPDLYPSGPCSKAYVIKDDWFNEDEKNY